MGNHAHFLFQVENIQELSKFFHKLNSTYARYYNYMENERVGYVYRDRFLSEPITNHRYLIQCIKYIHYNPVKAQIVNNCEDYKFSSYRVFKNKLIEKKFNNILDEADYKEICNNINYDMTFLDIDMDKEEEMLMCIKQFTEKRNCKIYDIFSNRKILEDLIFYLKNERKIKYKQISDFFDITRGTIQKIAIKNKKT